MTEKLSIFINLYVVPLTAVLLSYFGYINGGTGYLITDIIVYSISFFLSYSIVYFFFNFYLNKTVRNLSISLYLLLITIFSLKINGFLMIPLTVIFTHLLFKTPKSEIEIDLNKPILQYIISSLPNKNYIFLGLYFLSLIIIVFLL